MNTRSSGVGSASINSGGASSTGITSGGASTAGATSAGASGTNAIAVLVSTATHPLSGRKCTSRNDTLALETARQLSGGTQRTLHVGNPQDTALPDYLAFGASSVEVLPVPPGDDAIAALAEQVRDAHLILCGTRTQSGEASGMLPYLLAASLKRPILAEVLEVQLIGDSVKATQFLPKGRRRTVTVSLPAIIAVHPLATAVPRYAYARRVAGRIETLAGLTPDSSATIHPTSSAARATSANAHPTPSAPPAAPATAYPTSAPSGSSTYAPSIAPPTSASRPSPWTLESADRVPVKLKAPDRRSGHARMLAATAVASRGGQVVNEGSDVEKAQAVLAYLREHDLIAL